MTNMCTNCWLSQQHCNCTDSNDYQSLSWTADDFTVPDELIRQVNSAVSDFRTETQHLSTTFSETILGGRNTRAAVAWIVGSIQTPAEDVDAATADIDMGDFGAIKRFLESTNDGRNKWSKVHEMWTTGIPDDVATLAQKGEWVEAQATLIGLTDDDRGRQYDQYLRVTKANMVTRVLGDTDSLCLDSRRYRVLKPLLEEMIPEMPPGGHSPDGPYRVQGTAVNDWNYSPEDEWRRVWLDDILTRNPEEYRALVTEILDALEEETRANREELSHLLFLLGGDTTYHDELQELLNTH